MINTSVIRPLFIILVVVFMSNSLAGQESKAKEMLDEVSAKVKDYDHMFIEFNYALNNESQAVSQETRGDVYLMGEKYRLNLMGTTQIYDGSKLYTIIPEDEEITISTQNPNDDDAITPSKMLTFFNEGYNYEWDIDQNVNGRKIQYIKLSPQDSESEIEEAMLGVDVQTKHIYRLIMTQKNDTKITITVNSFKTDQPVASNLFAFDEKKYPGYYINRLD